jgi:hypothetical protein
VGLLHPLLPPEHAVAAGECTGPLPAARLGRKPRPEPLRSESALTAA